MIRKVLDFKYIATVHRLKEFVNSEKPEVISIVKDSSGFIIFFYKVVFEKHY